jgi:hypothetical protein
MKKECFSLGLRLKQLLKTGALSVAPVCKFNSTFKIRLRQSDVKPFSLNKIPMNPSSCRSLSRHDVAETHRFPDIFGDVLSRNSKMRCGVPYILTKNGTVLIIRKIPCAGAPQRRWHRFFGKLCDRDDDCFSSCFRLPYQSGICLLVVSISPTTLRPNFSYTSKHCLVQCVGI